MFFNPHQRCGYSDSPFARTHCFYTAGCRNGLEGWPLVGDSRNKEVVPKKNILFVTERYLRDMKQGQKLLELVMKLTRPAKEELRRIFDELESI